MPWILPGSATTGNVIPAAWGNDVNGDLTILQSSVGLYGGGNALVGSLLPAQAAPNYLIQAGFVSATFSSGLSGLFSFPAVFPNGLLSLTVSPVSPAAAPGIVLNLSGTSLTAFSLGATSGAGSAYTGVINVSWIAIGC